VKADKPKEEPMARIEDNNRSVVEDMLAIKKSRQFSSLCIACVLKDDSAFIPVIKRIAMLKKLTKLVKAGGVPLGFVGFIDEGGIVRVESRMFPMYDGDPGSQKIFDQLRRELCVSLGLNKNVSHSEFN
jgi:hypothetical protein